jgi:hypothetical protein
MLTQQIKSDAASPGVMMGPSKDNSVKVDRWTPNFTNRGEGNESAWKGRRLGVKSRLKGEKELGEWKWGRAFSRFPK